RAARRSEGALHRLAHRRARRRLARALRASVGAPPGRRPSSSDAARAWRRRAARRTRAALRRRRRRGAAQPRTRLPAARRGGSVVSTAYAFTRLFWRPATLWSLLVLATFGLGLHVAHGLLAKGLPWLLPSQVALASRFHASILFVAPLFA